MNARIQARHHGRGPRMLRDADHRSHPNRNGEHDHQIKGCAVHEDAIRLFLHDANGHAHQEEETEEENALELGAILTDRMIQLSQDHYKRAEADTGHTQSKKNVRWTEDFHIETVGVVPIVVEGGRGNHCYGSPDAEERAERAAEPPYRNGMVAQRRTLAERGGKNEICTSEAREDAAELNQDVRRRQERVAANALMPRNVPDAANDAADD